MTKLREKEQIDVFSYKCIYKKEMDLAHLIDKIEQVQKEQDAIYHNAAVRFGISDTVMWILYMLYEAEGAYTQQELCKKCFFPKQTVNTAVSNLMKKGDIVLESIPGTRNQKRILLTEKGRAFAKKTAWYVRRAELRAYGKMTEEELMTFLRINQKLTSCLKEEMNKEINFKGENNE